LVDDAWTPVHDIVNRVNANVKQAAHANIRAKCGTYTSTKANAECQGYQHCNNETLHSGIPFWA
jgi:hypothetical protein